MSAVEVRVPGDKSITHRVLLLATLADGESRISGLLDAADTRTTAALLRSLGASVPEGPLGVARIRGGGLESWRAPAGPLDCGNSGTTARLFLGALAGMPFESRLTGDASLRARPMRRVTAPLAAAGAEFEELERPDRLPIHVRGSRPLRPIDHDGPRASAQVKSALLLAGLTGRAAVRVSEPGRSRDHTERLLAAMGAAVRIDGREGGRIALSMEPPPRLDPLDVRVPGDPSSAAFFLALAALLGPVRVRGTGLNPTRTGALAVLRRMGVPVDVEEHGVAAGEPVGDIVADRAELRGASVRAEEVPALLDEVPVLAALAAVADGETRFEGVGELRVKETDRVAALVENLRALGVAADAGPDTLVVSGTRGPLRGRIRSFGDHRIAMAFGVLGAAPGNEVVIDDPGVVEISYPGFWQDLDSVRRELTRT